MEGTGGDRHHLRAPVIHLVWLVDCRIRRQTHIHLEHFNHPANAGSRQQPRQDRRQRLRFHRAPHLLRSGSGASLRQAVRARGGARQYFPALPDQLDSLHGTAWRAANIPTFIGITDGKVHDVNMLDEILPEAGAFYVMDRGYVDFERLYVFTLSAAFFVVRTKSNVLLQRRYSHPVDETTGV